MEYGAPCKHRLDSTRSERSKLVPKALFNQDPRAPRDGGRGMYILYGVLSLNPLHLSRYLDV